MERDSYERTRSSRSERVSKSQFSYDIESTVVVPVSDVARLFGTVFIQLSDHHIDIVLYNILLLGQGLGGEVVTELLPHLAMMLGITNSE